MRGLLFYVSSFCGFKFQLDFLHIYCLFFLLDMGYGNTAQIYKFSV